MEAGIIFIGDVFEGVNLMSFEQMVNKYKIPRKEFWKYLQLRSSITSVNKKHPLISQTDIQEVFQSDWLIEGGASRFYRLMRHSQPPKTDGLKRSWEEDLGREISQEVWKDIVGSWYRTSREMQTRLITYKIINRGYWTPCKMARLKLRESDICWRCDEDRGTLLHMLYECKMTQNLWENMITFLGDVLGAELLQSPALCILGIITEGVGLSAQQTLWCRLALITGCRVVLRHWKTKGTIPFNEWMVEMTKIASYEQMIYKLNHRQEVFQKIWGPYINVISG